MNKFSGIDLHSNNSVVVVSDEADRIVYRQRLPNELPAILQELEPHRSELVGVVVESTYNWYWLVDGLQVAGYQVHLANTVAIKKYDGLKYSGDFTDAAHLAQLLRLGILPHGYICPPARRVVRDLARRRMQLVRLRTMQVLSIENVLSRQTGHRLKSNEVKRLTPEAVEGLGFPADVTLSMQANVAVMKTLQQQIDTLEGRLLERVKPEPAFVLLQSVPGIGVVLATVIMLEICDIARFASAGDFSSYCRCVRSVHESNSKKKGEGNTKNGNEYLSWAFVEAAHGALRTCPQAKRFYERKKCQRNGAVASKALAHKLARACFHILRTGKPFEVQRCFV
jgi:transposase